MTAEQRTEALRKAAEARAARSAALAKVRQGHLTLTAVLDGQEPALQRAYVRQVLCALPGVGKVTAERAIAEAGIDPDRRVKGLGPNQRKALAERFAPVAA
jgi:hypothetical protein